MIVVDLGDGYAINGDCTDKDVVAAVHVLTGDLPLIVTDPPYGNILKVDWDDVLDADEAFANWMSDWTVQWSKLLLPGAAFYVWGGIGKPGFRPFFKYVSQVEKPGEFELSTLITWNKKRAYGIKWGYLFTREELAYFVKGDAKKPRCFNIPLLDAKRGYAGYNKKYPAKSEFYRRTNVWTDVNELFQGKLHDAQKPERVIQIPIETHTQPNEWVVDMFAGSGTTGVAARSLGRRFVLIEKDEESFKTMLERLPVKAST